MALVTLQTILAGQCLRNEDVALAGGVGHAAHRAGGPDVSGRAAGAHRRAPHLAPAPGGASAPPLFGPRRQSHACGALGRGAPWLAVTRPGGHGGCSGEDGGGDPPDLRAWGVRPARAAAAAAGCQALEPPGSPDDDEMACAEHGALSARGGRRDVSGPLPAGWSPHAHPETVAHCRTALGPPPVEPPPALDWQTVCAQRGDAHPEQCPTCGQLLVCTGVIPRGGHRRPWWRGSVRHDTSTAGDRRPGVGCAWCLPCGDPTRSGGRAEHSRHAGNASDAVACGAVRACRRHVGVRVTRHNLHSARRSTPVRPHRHAVSPTKS
jgi:hypothetical protein